MRAAWLVAGAVVTVFALLVSTALLWREFARARTPSDTTLRSIPFDQQEVRVKAGKGQVNLFIMPGRAGELLIQRSLRWSRDRPTVTEDWDIRSRTLRLDAVCPGYDQPDGPVCQADYLVSVPPETDIEASTTGGELNVNRVFGSVRLSSVSGNVHVRDLSGPLWARTGTGKVDAEGLDGEQADVEVGFGDVELSFVNAPTSVKAVVRTSGDVRVAVPPVPYQVTADAAETFLDVRKDAAAPRKIIAKAPSGVVTLCCR
ncbi:DUF4097 family beta strand repeat-containing protein [Nonomuraea sp. M3C6]|uniref:DUF4097 family beta strand repeat-containing protein n=1 Tax=Nonomuraea marmarensis TaxID=3351344 RepID=A0ABW7AT73_9ACTN